MGEGMRQRPMAPWRGRGQVSGRRGGLRRLRNPSGAWPGAGQRRPRPGRGALPAGVCEAVWGGWFPPSRSPSVIPQVCAGGEGSQQTHWDSAACARNPSYAKLVEKTRRGQFGPFSLSGVT